MKANISKPNDVICVYERPARTPIAGDIYSIISNSGYNFWSDHSYYSGDLIYVLEPVSERCKNGLICSVGNWRCMATHGIYINGCIRSVKDTFIYSYLEERISLGEFVLVSPGRDSKIKCECGGEATRTTHSTWCPKWS